MHSVPGAEREAAKERPVTKGQLAAILLTAAAAIAICSKSSPLYPLNDWGDANCFLTVGKSILHGKVPYRDLFEQKGPLLYLLYALAALVSERSFLGGYFLEVAACAVFLFYSFRIIRLFRDRAGAGYLPLLAAAVYSSPAFSHGGSAEELCLPLLAFTLYAGLRTVREGRRLSAPCCLMIGVTAACVLWIKFSLLGFYLGWLCVPAALLIRQRKAGQLAKDLLLVLLGAALLSLPVLLYFGKNNALGDLWNVYFYDNLFLYSVSSETAAPFSLVLNLLRGADNLFLNFLLCVLAALGMRSVFKQKDRPTFLFLLAAWVGTFLLVYLGGRHYVYYSLVFSVFAPVGMGEAARLVEKLGEKRFPSGLPQLSKAVRSVLICTFSAVFAFLTSTNTYLIWKKQADLPQFQFAEILSQTENATLLNYGFLDGGFYTVAGIVPNCRFFCGLNLPLDEIGETMDEFLAEGKVEFVVTRDSPLEAERYVCVAEASYYYEGSDKKFYLYRLAEETP